MKLPNFINGDNSYWCQIKPETIEKSRFDPRADPPFLRGDRGLGAGSPDRRPAVRLTLI